MLRACHGPKPDFKSLLNDSLAIAAYMSTPCHIELILAEKEAPVKAEVILYFPSCLEPKAAEKLQLKWLLPNNYSIESQANGMLNLSLLLVYCGICREVEGSLLVQEKKPRKLSKKEAAKRLRSGTSSALAKKA